MIKVITYGTYDLLHYGHIKLLERAKALGDYLIVGVTSDDFDKQRGKINVQQTLEERVAAVRATGLADKIIIEEYEGQKIDDIKKYGIDIFTVGSDWKGYFDYLKEYCQVIYLPRTQGVSSTEIRDNKSHIRFGLVGYANYLNRVFTECQFVNGVKINGLCAENTAELSQELLKIDNVTRDYTSFLSTVDAVYIHSHPDKHYEEVKQALLAGKHVMCESPIAENKEQCEELIQLANENNLVLMDSLRTAYSTAFSRMLLLIKGGKIGDVVSIDATCTSLNTNSTLEELKDLRWSSMTAWGPTAMLPIFKVLGTDYSSATITSKCEMDPTDKKINTHMDDFSEIVFRYAHALATIKVGSGVKSEGELIISGTKGYVYVPAPWWKTDYFEIRYENPADNKRYFYQLDGEGIRYEWVAFVKMINAVNSNEAGEEKYIDNIERYVSIRTCEVMDDFLSGKNVFYI